MDIGPFVHGASIDNELDIAKDAGIEPNKKWWAGSSAEAGLFGHGTSVRNGLAIAQDRGQMFTSRGKCGRGTYFLPLRGEYQKKRFLKSCGT